MLLPIGDDQIKGGYFPIISYSFIVINIAVFLYQISLGEGIGQFVMHFGSIPAEITRGQDLYTLFTSMFLHGGWGHLLGNMLFLWIFADNIEAIVGSRRFLFLYLLGGLLAHALHIFFYPDSGIPTVGASGAISAVMGAYIVMFPTSRVKVLFFIIPFRVPAFIFLGIWIFLQINSGLETLNYAEANVGVAYWAHIGGFIYGLVQGLIFRPHLKRPLARYE
jgi:membrane associated rhomboid family serine protease